MVDRHTGMPLGLQPTAGNPTNAIVDGDRFSLTSYGKKQRSSQSAGEEHRCWL